jgi:hypothetical protein
MIGIEKGSDKKSSRDGSVKKGERWGKRGERTAKDQRSKNRATVEDAERSAEQATPPLPTTAVYISQRNLLPKLPGLSSLGSVFVPQNRAKNP